MADKKKWTVMVYMTGDGDLADNCVDDLKEMKRVGSNDAIDVIAQYASGGNPGIVNRYHIKPEEETRSLKADVMKSDLPSDLDMGKPETLLEFIRWGFTEFKAEKHMLVLWGHGAGIIDQYYASKGVLEVKARTRGLFAHVGGPPTAKGINWDDKTHDFLDNQELREVLKTVTAEHGKIDILGLDACLMGMAEVGFQVAGYVEYMVASEALVPLYSWPYDKILQALKEGSTDSAMEADDLASKIVDLYVHSYEDYEDTEVTYSAVELDSISSEVTVKRVGNLAKKLASGMFDGKIKPAIVLSRLQAQCYDELGYIDLHDFCDLLFQYCPAGTVQDECKAVMESVSSSVLNTKSLGDSMNRSCGLSIYLPLADFSEDYKRVEFAGATGWGEFAETFAKESRRPADNRRLENIYSDERRWRHRWWPRHKVFDIVQKNREKEAAAKQTAS